MREFLKESCRARRSLAPMEAEAEASTHRLGTKGDGLMKLKTNVKAGGYSLNRCESLAVKTGVKAGGLWANRCESFRRA